MIHVCVDASQLRAALKEIEQAEANGFLYCLAVFGARSAGRCLEDTRIEYEELVEKAHPTDPTLSWGCGQRVTKNHRFKDGKLLKK